MAWIDEEAAIFSKCQLGSKNVVTKHFSEINFLNSAQHGDIVEIGMESVAVGRTSITLRCVARNKMTKEVIITIDKIVFVLLGDDGRPAPHGTTMADLADSES